MMTSGELTLRFLVAPTDVGYSGNVDGGRALEWIDKAAFALATAWSGQYCVTVHVGNVYFRNPVHAGDLVEATARLVHTGRTSMHCSVALDAVNARTGERTEAATCVVVFVALDEQRRPVAVPAWAPTTDIERTDDQVATHRIELAADIERAMATEVTDGATTAPSVTLRFLAAPSDVSLGGSVHGGHVMQWMDEAAHVLATQWTGVAKNVAFYAGGIRFYHPLAVGELVEIEARLLHTGTKSMHIAVHVRSADPADMIFKRTTHALLLFVALNDAGQAIPCPAFVARSEADVALEQQAQELASKRAALDSAFVSNPRRTRARL